MKKILHFTADWCTPCKKIKPVIEEFVSENIDVEYIQIDIDKDFRTAQNHAVQSIPTLIILVDEDVRARHTGVITLDGLKDLVDSAK
jgi:thiol-disulfide isomerase/thioredoxin